MTHAREQIRYAVKDILDDLDFKEVFVNSNTNFHQDKLPAARVSVDTETSEFYTSDQDYSRDATVLVTVCERGDQNLVTDKLDALSVSIEKAMQSADLGFFSELTGTRFESSTEGEHHFEYMTLQYSIKYHTPQGDPETLQ